MKRIHAGGPQQAPPRRTPVKGYRDSLQRCQAVPDVYLAIRYHGRPALQKNPPRPMQLKPLMPAIEKELQDKFENTNFAAHLLLIKQVIGYLFMLLFWPFNFLFNDVPKAVLDVLVPIFTKLYHQNIVPIYRYVVQKMQPLIWLYQKLSIKVQAIAHSIGHSLVTIFQVACHLGKPPLRQLFGYLKATQNKFKSDLQAKIATYYLNMRSFLRNPLKVLKMKVQETVKSGLQTLLHPVHITKQALKIKREKIFKSLGRIAKLIKSFISLMYLGYVWAKVFVRYFIKIVKQAFNEQFYKPVNQLKS